MTTSLGDRMKENYERRFQYHLMRRTPVIIRVDGKVFHTLTSKCQKPFDDNLIHCMSEVARVLCGNIQGAKCAYQQSDEISILLIDYDELTTQAWFDYNLQKIVSVSASLASATFSQVWGKVGLFDSRAFNIPKEEVANYFVWRQKDWIRNSISMLAQSNFSHNQLQNKSQEEMILMLNNKGIYWIELGDTLQNGIFVTKVQSGENTYWSAEPAPIFTQNRKSIEQYLGEKE